MRYDVVCAAVVERDGQFLLTRRRPGDHLGGCWEFPGGKLEPGETLAQCLQREMCEELGVTLETVELVFTATHRGADRVIQLHFFSGTVRGEPQARLGQEMAWVRREDLARLRWPPADEELVRRLVGGGSPGCAAGPEASSVPLE